MLESDLVASFKREDLTASRTAFGKGKSSTDAEDDLLRLTTTARANGIRHGVDSRLNLRDKALQNVCVDILTKEGCIGAVAVIAMVAEVVQ
jgi:hypothetical protein